MIDYLKYCLSPTLLGILLFCDWLGMPYVWIFFVGFSSFLIIGDYIFGKDQTLISTSNSILNGICYISLPLLLIKLFHITLLGMGDENSVIYHILNQDAIFQSWKHSYSIIDLVGIVLTSGLFFGGLGTVVGHELVHRKKSSFAFKISNWLLALTWDPAFGIEHIHGHHKNVATLGDPNSARRNENVYRFIIRSTIGTIKNAWMWETENLKKNGHSPFSSKNQLFQGYLRSIILTAIVSLGGWTSLIVYFFSIVWAKILLETVNYLEHYGLLRVPGKPVEPKHSWNSNHRISSLMLFNLTRHSAHHEKGTLPFWELNPYETSPMLPYGYLSLVYFILLFPRWYLKMMEKSLKHWDKNFASGEELNLL